MSRPTFDTNAAQVYRTSVEMEAVDRRSEEDIQQQQPQNGDEESDPENLKGAEENKKSIASYIRYNAFGTAMGFFVNGYMYDISTYIVSVYTDVFPSFRHDVFLQTAIGVSMLYGVMFGLLLFGFIADYFGRKKGLIMCSCLVLLGNIIGVASHGTSVVGGIWMMNIGLGVAGLGMGGEYTCNVPNAMEDSEGVNIKTRGRRTSMLVMCMEVIGNYMPFVVQIIIIAAACRNAYLGAASHCHYEIVKRVSFAVATIPVICVLIYRTRMRDSEMFSKDKQRGKSRYDAIDLYIVCRHFAFRSVGAVLNWFLVDYINYSMGTFGVIILQSVIGVSLLKSLWITLAEGGAYLIWLPFVAAFVVDRLGRRKTEVFGWAFLASAQLINAGAFWPLKRHPVGWIFWSTFVFGFQYFVFVPVYLIPAEAFPTKIRATMYGVSSSFGKCGGIVGTTIFPHMWVNFSGSAHAETLPALRLTMWFYAGLEYLALLLAFFFVPEYSQKSLVKEDQRFYELRRRYAARFAKRLNVTDEDLQEDSLNLTFFQILKYRITSSSKEQFHRHLKNYAATLCRENGIRSRRRIDYVAQLPTDYNDLTLFSRILRKIRMGSEQCAIYEKNSEEMGYYDPSVEEAELEDRKEEWKEDDSEMQQNWSNTTAEAIVHSYEDNKV
ncbi:hypothetical protein GAYE_PCTG52G1238 [Galdieria yellowstonensis]|uniref:Major facilitator superfamily (MFS) profile domain-containing protein n=1 Tax=Galdieria yellowstonensis TaxID=3028027 RepID=A0AAV9I4G1_9RHOD|nr:hypothetical protein GAYE_PCTG52G1238 [Galdieria yellowstonensis]